jgi:tetratricopeptide (TPR) repeat protein/SAM-dependent methyltransferase
VAGDRQSRVAREALARGAEHHRAGRFADAARAYADAVRAERDNADALALLGAVTHRLGRSPEALALLERALALDPRHAVALASRGRVLLATGRPEEAEEAFAAALAVRGDFPEARLGLARARRARGDAAGAEAAALTLLQTRPGDADALSILGGAQLDAGRPAEAEASLRRAIAARPGDARLHADLGAALLAQDQHEAAAQAWRMAAALDPALPDLAPRRAALARTLGLTHLAVGSVAAIGWLREAVALDPADRGALLGLADALFQAPTPPPDAGPELCVLLDAPGIDHQRVERAVRTVLVEIPGVYDAIQAFDTWRYITDTSGCINEPGSPAAAPTARPARAPDVAPFADALVGHPLFGRWLTRTIVAHPAGQALLAALRDELLARVERGTAVPIGALEALAMQAWNTEYAAGTSPTQEARLTALAALPHTPERHAAFAMFRSLAAWPGAESTALTAPGWEDRPLATLVRAQLVVPAEEAALAASLSSLGAPTDPTSQLVQAQYEAHPYPRLVGVHHREAGSFAGMLAALLGTAAEGLAAGVGGPVTRVGERAVEGRREPLRVLIAGGGTGQHPIAVASCLRDAEIVCIDLSAASLGRAARLARAHGLEQIHFVQGDLLALADPTVLPGTFGFVDCVGVLHHLADPVAGGRALAGRLAPGGLLRLGVYSERGRTEIVAARRLAEERGWVSTDAGLRTARAELARLPATHPAARVAASPDFHSQSGLRDLVFHPCEHRYTPTQVDVLVRAIGLEVVGLQHARPEGSRAYRERWPADTAMVDLARWERVEAEHPRIFAGMIHVWCRAPA